MVNDMKRAAPGVAWNPETGKWDVDYLGRRAGGFRNPTEAGKVARRFAKERQQADRAKAAPKGRRRETEQDRERCAKCRWRMVLSNPEGKARYHCGYSLEESHRSRVALHYERTGRESLEGFTFGADCTEFEGRQRKQAKKTLGVKRQRTVPMDMGQWEALRKGRSFTDLGAAVGCTGEWARATGARGTIRQVYAERLLEKYGVDVRRREG